MQDKSENEGRIQDDRNFNDKMQDKNIHRKQDLLIFTGSMKIVFKLTVGCGMKNGKPHVTDMTWSTSTPTR